MIRNLGRTAGLAGLAAGLTTLAGPALAHGAHAPSGFAAGLAHPVLGADHLLAMLAVGLWAALAAPRAPWAAPAGFLAGMALGGALGLAVLAPAGFAVPGVEALAMGSVVLFGALAFARARVTPLRAMGIAAIFGAAHGLAHATGVMSAAPDFGWTGFAAGFLIATAALQAAGALGGIAARRGGLLRLGQAAGAGVAVAGGYLMVA